MSPKKNILINAAVTVVLIAVSLVLNHFFFAKKIAFVNLNDVYDKFELTKKFEENAEKASVLKNNILDSLKLKLEMNYRNLQTKNKDEKNLSQEDILNFNLLKKEYASKKENFEKTNGQMLKSYDEQIWTQINTYILEFGKEGNYDLVLGANGSGSIMYSSQMMDITGEAVEYINAKYKGH